jgi:hypothetical protein
MEEQPDGLDAVPESGTVPEPAHARDPVDDDLDIPF